MYYVHIALRSLYVDDFLICYRSKYIHIIERHLQQCLNKLSNWADTRVHHQNMAENKVSAFELSLLLFCFTMFTDSLGKNVLKSKLI